MQSMKRIEYICTHCGQRITKNATAGRPMPGNCPRKEKTKDGKMRPHTWRVNRRL